MEQSTESTSAKDQDDKKRGRLWPYGIIVAFILFIAFFVYIVTRVYQTDSSLVSQNSYYEGLNYQDRKDAISRAKELGVEIHDLPDKQILVVTIPKGKDRAKGEVYFYRPSDESLDFTVSLDLDSKNQQIFALKALEPGYWTAKLTFKIDDQAYYSEYGFNR